MESFAEVCHQLMIEYNRKRITDNRLSEDIIYNFSKLDEKVKEAWLLEAKRIIELNEKEEYVGSAVILLTQTNHQDFTLKMLKKYPIRVKNNWNEIIIFALVEIKYPPLGKEFEMVEKVLSTLSEISRFQFLMRFIHLNETFGLKHLFSILQNELENDNFSKNYSTYIFQTLQKIDVKLPSKLITCLLENGSAKAAQKLIALENVN